MSKKETIFSPKTIKRFQWFNYPLFRSTSLIAARSRRNISLEVADLDVNISYVIVANHQGMLDPFIICYGFSRKADKVLVPVHFLTANRFMNRPILTQWLALMGSFPAKKHKKYPSGLRMAEHLLNNNQTVMIFPEGRVSKLDREHKPKRGVEVLSKIPNVMLIPARVKWQRNHGFVNGYSLAIGKPFDGSNMSAGQIMDEVYKLTF